jgi:putative FmdB family regulatory protein
MMPLYDFACDECGAQFERKVSLSDYDNPQPCESCGDDSSTRRIITAAPGVVFKGDNWATKAGRVRKQMAAKNERLAARERDYKGDGGIPQLAPNVGGQRVDSWSEAKKLAASKGKDTSSYEPYIRKEKTT